MKTKYIYQIGAAFLGLLLLVGCTEFEEFEAEDLGNGPALTISLVSAADSSITVDLSSNAAGYVAAVLMIDTTNAIPADPQSLAQGDVINEEYFYSEVDANGTVSYTFTASVEQDAMYEIMAVAANEDGVLSEVEVLEVRTDDSNAPGLVATYPGFTYDPTLAQGDTIVLEFDEPVQLGEGAFSIETFFTGQLVEVPAENVIAQGPYVFVILPAEFPYREYIWMHWEANAVTDLSGNGVDALTTYFDGDAGAFVGAYWRMMTMPIAVESVAPGDGTTQAAGFDIVMSFGTGVDAGDVADGDITLTYDDGAGIVTMVGVPAADVAAAGGDVTVSQNAFAATTGTVTIDVPEGIIFDAFGNPNSAFTASWTLE